MPDERRRDIVEALREADRAIAREQMSSESDLRLRELVQGRAPRRRSGRTGWVLVGAAAAATVAVVAWLVVRAVPGSPPGALPAPVAGLRVTSGKMKPTGEYELRCASERCTIEAEEIGLELSLGPRTVIRSTRGRVVLVEGRALCEVEHRAARRELVRVHVSHGHVEVLGTRFALAQHATGGVLRVLRGRVRYVTAAGAATRPLRAGEQLRWPLPPDDPRLGPAPSDAAAPAPAVPAQPDSAALAALPRLTADEAIDVLRDVEALRDRRRYRTAVARLRRALPRIARRATRELFSYELGTILSRQLNDRRAACRHWRWHLRSFVPQRFGREISSMQRQLECDTPSGRAR